MGMISSVALLRQRGKQDGDDQADRLVPPAERETTGVDHASKLVVVGDDRAPVVDGGELGDAPDEHLVVVPLGLGDAPGCQTVVLQHGDGQEVAVQVVGVSSRTSCTARDL